MLGSDARILSSRALMGVAGFGLCVKKATGAGLIGEPSFYPIVGVGGEPAH